MQVPATASVCFRVGEFEVDLRCGELRQNGSKIKLQQRPFQILAALLERPGEVVTREEIQQKLWPTDTFVDFEHSINTAVNKLREALDDDIQNPRFIETLPRYGYRLIAPVDILGLNGAEVNGTGANDACPEIETLPVVPPQEGSRETSQQKRQHTATTVVALVALLAGASVTLFFLKGRTDRSARENQTKARAVPLTTMPGREVSPAFSPDGSEVVFAWDGGNGDATKPKPVDWSAHQPVIPIREVLSDSPPFDLYVKALGSEKLDQLTHEPAEWIVPAWSPDGGTIAFVRAGGAKEGLFAVSPRGGPERKLADARFAKILWMSLSWSPDGRQLLYYTTDGLRILTIDDGHVHAVDTGQCHLPTSAAFSPDGKWIAFDCEVGGHFYLNLLSLQGEATRHLFKEWGDNPLAWTNDSQRVLLPGLWEVNINSGEAHSLDYPYGLQPAVSRQADRLAYVSWHNKPSIWRADTRSGLSRSVIAPNITEQREPDISPDGKRIVFKSSRSGFEEIWVANLDGTDAEQLSNFHAQTGSPRWSPDGRWIAFDSHVTDKPALYLVDPITARPQQISTNGILGSNPGWSADGRSIYLTSQLPQPAEQLALYRVSPQGGIPERVAQARGYNPQASKDGRMLYFATDLTNTSIDVLEIATGEQHTLKGLSGIFTAADWILGSKGIYFVVPGPEPGIYFYDFGSQQVTRRIPFDRQPFDWGGLSLSPDETWIAYAQADQTSANLMLVEGFR